MVAPWVSPLTCASSLCTIFVARPSRGWEGTASKLALQGRSFSCRKVEGVARVSPTADHTVSNEASFAGFYAWFLPRVGS